MGLTNYKFTSMEDITDVEAKGYYKELLEKGKTEEEAFEIIAKGTREHGRILLPWEETLETAPELVKSQVADMEVRDAYRRLIALRKEDKTLIYGGFELLCGKKDRFVYRRFLGDKEYIIDCNLGKKVRKAYKTGNGYKLVFESVKCKDKKNLYPYDARIWVK